MYTAGNKLAAEEERMRKKNHTNQIVFLFEKLIARCVLFALCAYVIRRVYNEKKKWYVTRGYLIYISWIPLVIQSRGEIYDAGAKIKKRKMVTPDLDRGACISTSLLYTLRALHVTWENSWRGASPCPLQLSNGLTCIFFLLRHYTSPYTRI